MKLLEEQEANVSDAFSKQSKIFDEIEEKNPVILWMREQVRKHELSILKPGETILELNAGTGMDGLFFAQKGFSVHATDNAEGMLDELTKKISANNLSDKITVQRCSFNNLENLYGKKYDHVFSNFGGLNCSENLSDVIKKLGPLLNVNATVTLVIMPPVCPWEIALALKGNFKVAFRRLNKNGAVSHLEGNYFKTYYYSPKYLTKVFGAAYKRVSLKGLASISPPPYLENIPRKYPRLYKMLIKMDEKLCSYKPFNSWADHYIITFRKQ